MSSARKSQCKAQSPDVSHFDIPSHINFCLYSAGPATGQIGQGSPRSSSVREQKLSWHQKSTKLIEIFPSKRSPPNTIKISSNRCPPPMLDSKRSTSHHLHLFTFPDASPCYQLAFTRRTSGHCLGIFRAVNFLTSPTR